MRARRILIVLGAVALVAIVAIGVSQAGGGGSGAGSGSGDRKSALPSDAQVTTRLAGAPAPLAALHAQANEILPGGKQAYAARLKALRGYPVVVNVWAAWCGPCRLELPSFQTAGLDYGKRVAFLGVNRADVTADAKKLLRQLPQTYPSYEDGDERVSRDLRVQAMPTTIFYDRRGRIVQVHQGPFLTAKDLSAAIRRYALS